jgi:Membrane bound beta barrel domain (DUF5777)
MTLGLIVAGARPARAQAAAPATPADPSAAAPTTAGQASAGTDDDEKLRPLEPDYSLINLPTTLPLPVHAGNFHLTHRFGENLRNDSFGTQASNLFGLDEGATIQLEYRYGVMKHLEAVFSRTNVQRTIQLSAKYDAFHESATQPIGVSAIVGIGGENNFKMNYAPALGVVLSRTIANHLAVYVTPVWAHNTFPGTGVMENTAYVGLGARVRLVPALFIVGEVSPRVSGYTPGNAEFAFSLEKRVGAHVFALTFANTAATTYAQIARGGNPSSLYLGFNLARKFF